MQLRVIAQVSAAAVISLALAGTAASTGKAAPTEKAAPTGKAAPKEYAVVMQITGFEPASLTVKPGDRITWTNKDLFPHTATADDKAFDSKSVAPAGSWTYVAGKPGKHAYICTFHPTMKGIITVQ